MPGRRTVGSPGQCRRPSLFAYCYNRSRQLDSCRNTDSAYCLLLTAYCNMRLFWRLGLTYLLLVLLALIAVDGYTARATRQDYLKQAFSQLESLGRLARDRPPRLDNVEDLNSWASWIAQSGARITLVAEDGRVLVDSSEDLKRMENHAERPEIREALAGGEGRAVRHSVTLDRDFVYLALRYQPPRGSPAVIRLALPVERLDQALSGFRRRLWSVFLLILVV